MLFVYKWTPGFGSGSRALEVDPGLWKWTPGFGSGRRALEVDPGLWKWTVARNWIAGGKWTVDQEFDCGWEVDQETDCWWEVDRGLEIDLWVGSGTGNGLQAGS